MFLSLAFFLAAVPAVASSNRAEDGPQPPKSPAPRVVSIISVTDDALLFREHIFTGLIVFPTGEKPPEGHALIVNPYYGIGTAVAVRFPFKDGAVYDIEDKKVGVEDVRKRLRAGDIVVVSTDHKKVDPAYLKAFAKHVLILVPPAPPPGPALPKPVEKKD